MPSKAALPVCVCLAASRACIACISSTLAHRIAMLHPLSHLFPPTCAPMGFAIKPRGRRGVVAAKCGASKRRPLATRAVPSPLGMSPLGDAELKAAAFKKTLDKDEARRGREETTISLRKEKRAEQLNKKRFGAAGPPAMPAAMIPQQQQQTVGSQAWQEANPTGLVEGVNSQDPQLQLPAVQTLRKCVGRAGPAPSHKQPALPRLVEHHRATCFPLRTLPALSPHLPPSSLPGC